MKKKIIERFLRYVAVDTQSDPGSKACPSTAGQLELARMLAGELKELGLADVKVDEYCCVTASLPANCSAPAPVIGLIAHMDTSPDMSGKGVKARVIDEYDGKDIILNDRLGIVTSTRDYPELLECRGHTLVCTDGTTLLGADNKAGVAEIMAALEHLHSNPDIQHGRVRIGFTPDEETGRGVDNFDVTAFGADFAYTIDGEGIGYLEYENFNGARASISIHGNSIHPGNARGKMINAAIVACELNALLPENERPEYTEGYEGFFHLTRLDAVVGNASVEYIIRDHDKALFERRKQQIRDAVAALKKKYGAGVLALELVDQYYNMKEKVEPVRHVIDRALAAMQKAGISAKIKPIRGGTDGARLSWMGLPCPNIFTGGYNCHGKNEFVSVDAMLKAVEVILNIISVR